MSGVERVTVLQWYPSPNLTLSYTPFIYILQILITNKVYTTTVLSEI